MKEEEGEYGEGRYEGDRDGALRLDDLGQAREKRLPFVLKVYWR